MQTECPTKDEQWYRKIIFPAGEMHLWLMEETLVKYSGGVINVDFTYKCSSDVFELLLLADTLRRNKIGIGVLTFKYMPFAQADRVNVDGECFSLKVFCELVNNFVKPESVIVHDPHSDVTPALLNNCRVVHQWEILAPIVMRLNFDCEQAHLVCPDAGAAKKIHKLATKLMMPVIQCEKIRDTKTGNIAGTLVHSDKDLHQNDMVIVDDICVGGRTFIEIAKILHQRNCGKIFLVTTNGVYSNGVDSLIGFVDEVWNQYGKVA